nr:putative glycoside hydrolase [Candidatus Kapabacteria bacterium]
EIIFFLIFLLTANIQTYSQIQTWPPDGLNAGPMQFVLPDSRIIPSTKRYNLVWADQLRPYLLTEGKIEFAAKNYVGTQKIWADQISQFRNYNENFLCLIYHLAAGLNPNKNDDCPDPKNNSGEGHIGVVSPAGYVSEWQEHFLPWCQSNSISEGSDRFESMFQHYNTLSPETRVWHRDPYWLMNLDNADWRTYVAAACKEWMTGNTNEGCFFDVSVETSWNYYNPSDISGDPYNFNWWETPYGLDPIDNRNDLAIYMNDTYLDYYSTIYQAFHSATVDYLVIPNIDQMVTSVYDPYWTDGSDTQGETIDGAMIENFGGYKASDMYLTLERAVRHLTGRGKIMIAQFGADSPEERYRRTGMYMLIKNENSYINIINTGNAEWYPEYEIDLGDQSMLPENLNDLRVSGDGWRSLWKREYEHGFILCNTSDADIFYNLGDEQAAKDGKTINLVGTSGGGEVSDEGQIAEQTITYEAFNGLIKIPSSECAIFKISDETSIEIAGSKSNSVSVTPNPASESFSVRLFLKHYDRIILT